MKRALSLLLCLVMVLVATGCGARNDASQNEALMAPGTYTGSGQGFYAGEKVQVSVTVDENSILDIDVSKDNGETPPILQSVIDKMVPRIIEHQSVYVDSITGATASSGAVRHAVIEALTKALEAAGSDPKAISAFHTVPEKKDVTETINTGVLVVGMGGSGSAAAMRAVEIMHELDPDNVNVLAIDKAGKYGGTSSATTGLMAVNPPRFQEEHNNGKDYMDKSAMRQAWLEYTEGDAKMDIVDKFLDNSGTALDWLVYDHGFKFSTPRTGFTPSDVYECWYSYIPTDTGANKDVIGKYFDGLYEKYTALGGKYMLETEAYDLIYDTATDTVQGVKARGYDGTEYEIYADAVILATGGFAGSGEMMTKYLSDEYYPLKGEWKVFGMQQNDGKMIEAAIDKGVGTYNIGMPPIVHMAGTSGFLTQFEKREIPGEVNQWYGRPAAWSPGDIPLNMVINPKALAVDSKGERFTAETGLGHFDPWVAGPNYFTIWSNNQVQRIKNEGFSTMAGGISTGFLGHGSAIPLDTPLPEIEEVLQAGVDADFIYKADSLSELAQLMGVDKETLEETVATYNNYCETGKDLDFGKPAEFLEKIEEGPYYAIVGASYCYSTSGGLDIDTNFNLLKADSKTPIPNLYAVGTDSMGVLFTEKKPYVTFGAAAQGWAYTSGYLCGEIAAKYVLEK
ncbi:MAG TPA: FAD-binding protein [Firmicutes bacterium]|nr:FAD-binding protein [Bacillota bacterium]